MEIRGNGTHCELNLVVQQHGALYTWPIVHYLGGNRKITKLLKQLKWHGIDCRERIVVSGGRDTAAPPFIERLDPDGGGPLHT